MEFSEKKIEDLIYNAIKSGNIEQLGSRGMYGVGRYKFFCRQLFLGEYGRLDLVGLNYRHGHGYFEPENKVLEVGLFEIKKGEIDYKAFIQAVRYCKAIHHYCDPFSITTNFKIYLIGTSVSKDDFCYISDILDGVEIYSVVLDLEKGIRFNREMGYTLSNPNFKPQLDVECSVKKMIKDVIRKEVFGDTLKVLIDGEELPF